MYHWPRVCVRALKPLLAFSVASVLLGAPSWVPAAGQRGAELAETIAPKADRLRRDALVIGNSAYRKSPLTNPVNDARAMQAALKQSGFDVVLLENASQAQMYEAIQGFGDRLREGGVGLFYYAGHGVQLKGRNLLIPVDATIEREEEAQYKSVDAGQLLDAMESAKNPLNIIILDACRSNPFTRSSRSLTTGLAQMEAPVGALIAFATAPGAAALDGQGKNGVYTHHLLKYITQPGLKVEDVFKQVRVGVRRETNGVQIPWESTSLEGDFYFVPSAATKTSTEVSSKAGQQQVDQKAVALEFWTAIKDSNNPYDYKAFLERFPNSEFASLARSKVADLTRPQPTKEAQVARKFSFSRAEEESAREWDARQAAEIPSISCNPARKSAPIKVQIDEQLLRGLAAVSSPKGGLAAEAIIGRMRAAGLNVVTSGPAKFLLQGTVTSQAAPNRRLALNEVSLNAAVRLTDGAGKLLSSAVHRQESYAGDDLYSVYTGLVAMQAADVVTQIDSDYCRKT